MLADVINTLLGLLVGLLTGYYFERRSSRETRRHNSELQDELRHLRESMYSVGRGPAASGLAKPNDESLENSLIEWMREYQGADGSIARSRVYQKFIAMGFGKSDVVSALALLNDRGDIFLDDVIQVR